MNTLLVSCLSLSYKRGGETRELKYHPDGTASHQIDKMLRC